MEEKPEAHSKDCLKMETKGEA